MRRFTLALVVAGAALAACGGADATSDPDPAAVATDDAARADDAPAAALRTVSATDAAAVIAGASDDLVVLDVRTAEEFAEAHLDGATMIDFYRTDFRDALGELDRDASYVLYCRSGNRSGETLQLMEELGFTSVTEIGGGILSWAAEGLPLTAG
ncbi:MAG: rhodanese-like domain-containing protein [Actinomycetota bacterium]